MIKLCEIISEISLDSFSNDKYEFIDSYLKDLFAGGLVDDLNQYVINYKFESPGDEDPYDDDDNEEIMETKDFKEWLKYELEIRYDDITDTIENLIANNKITIYRRMTVPDKWKDDLQTAKNIRVGIYWSYDEDAAEAHWGEYKKDKDLLLLAEIDNDIINWDQTFYANMNVSIGDDEKEITLDEHTQINIIGIYFNDKEISIPEGIRFTT